MADGELALLQHRTRLYLADVPRLSAELFRQLALQRFGRLRPIRVEPAAALAEMLLMALDDEEREGGISADDGPKEARPRSAPRGGGCLPCRAASPQRARGALLAPRSTSVRAKHARPPPQQIAEAAADLLCSRAEMLNEYFAIDIEPDGALPPGSAAADASPRTPSPAPLPRGAAGVSPTPPPPRIPRSPPRPQRARSAACRSSWTSTAPRRSGSRLSSSASPATRAGRRRRSASPGSRSGWGSFTPSGRA